MELEVVNHSLHWLEQRGSLLLELVSGEAFIYLYICLYELLRDQFSLDPRKLFFPLLWGLVVSPALFWGGSGSSRPGGHSPCCCCTGFCSCAAVCFLSKSQRMLRCPSHRDSLFARLKWLAEVSGKLKISERCGIAWWDVAEHRTSFLPLFSPHKQQAVRLARPAIQALHALCRFFCVGFRGHFVSEVCLSLNSFYADEFHVF